MNTLLFRVNYFQEKTSIDILTTISSESEYYKRLLLGLKRNRRKLQSNKTTNFGSKSTIFIGAKVWNSLQDELRSTTMALTEAIDRV